MAALFMYRRISLLVALGLLSHVTVTAQDRPRSLDIIERAGVSLVLMDIEVLDEEGRPMPGLTKEDFAVRVNGFSQPVYSVDDFCDVEGVVGPRQRSTDTADERTARVVMYLDFSQLQQAARMRAIDTALEFIEKKPRVMLVQVVGYSSLAGVREYSPFTQDRDVLAAAVVKARDDASMVDPFPVLRDMRFDICDRCRGSCRSECKGAADAEYLHGRRSLSALRWYIRGLEQFPERKVLLYFHQNTIIYPARIYRSDDFEVGDHLTLMNEIGADATLAQTVLFSAYAADTLDFGAEHAVNTGANLADFTGGRYNRGAADLMPLLTGSAEVGECVYRIGILEPPRAPKGVLRVVVSVRGRDLPYRYRTQFLDELDRWMRRAQLVLAAPERSDDVHVAAALVPLAATKDGWRVAVEVAVDPDSLTLVPSQGKYAGKWEVGALVYNESGNKKWEMLSISELQAPTSAPGSPIVHEYVLPSLKTGSYRVAAFARDATANLFGGAEGRLELPDRRVGIVGPQVRGAPEPHVVSSLGLIGEPGRPERGSVRVGHVPMSTDATVERGAVLAYRTLACPTGRPPTLPIVLRFVTTATTPLFRFEEIFHPGSDGCLEVLDPIDTTALAPGEYQYHLRWRAHEKADERESTATFKVEGARPTPAGGDETPSPPAHATELPD